MGSKTAFNSLMRAAISNLTTGLDNDLMDANGDTELVLEPESFMFLVVDASRNVREFELDWWILSHPGQ